MATKNYITGLGVFCLLAFAGCEKNTVDDPTTVTPTEVNTGDDENDFVENQSFTSTLTIVWSGNSAEVSGSAEGVNVSNENGYVTVTSSAKHVAYALSGEGQGQLTLYSDYKYELLLNGLTLTCADGPAINSQCKKTGYIVVSGANTLTDGSTYASSDEDRKAAFFSEGQLVFTGAGSLTVNGNYKHALASDDYIRIREGVLSLNTTVSDGLHTNDGIIIDGGTIIVQATGEGLQCDTSSVLINGGSLTITAGDKGILSYGPLVVNDGDVQVTSVNKGIKATGDITVNGGRIHVFAGVSASGSQHIVAFGPGNPGGGNPGGGNPGGGNDSSGAEGIESKAALTITGGEVYSYATDDAINSGGDLTISGGWVCAHSTGNDGIDANGNCYIKGGVVYAIGASSPEVAIDANSEERKQLYVTGGTLVAIGGLESGASLSQTCYAASTWSKSTWYALYKDAAPVLAFITPSSGGSTLVVSTGGSTTLKSGVTATGNDVFNGTSFAAPNVSGGSEVNLSSYSGSSRW